MSTTAKKMQSSYNRLYGCLREYIWDIDVVSEIADLETKVYQAFPNVESVQAAFDKVSKACKDVKDDPDMLDALNSMQKAIDASGDIYVKLWTPDRKRI